MNFILLFHTIFAVMFLNSQMGLSDNMATGTSYKRRQKRSIETQRIATAYSQKTSCPFTSKQIVCDPTIKYRSFDGTCNNLKNVLYGSVNTPYQRFLQPEYADGTDMPRVRSVNAKDSLPNPRILSKTIFSQTTEKDNEWLSIYVHFGQFIAHDLSQNSLSSGILH